MGPKLTRAEGFILGTAAKIFTIAGPGDCVRCVSFGDLRPDLLDNNTVLTNEYLHVIKSSPIRWRFLLHLILRNLVKI